MLRALADDRAYGLNWTKSRVTAALVEAREDIKYNPDAVDCFIRSGMVNLFEYDKHLATAVGEGNNQIGNAINFDLIQNFGTKWKSL